MKKSHLSLAVLAAIVPQLTSQAGIVFTFEDPGVQATGVSGVLTETFDSGSPGAFSGAIAMGSLSTGGAKVQADVFGGAGGSQYYAVGVQSGVFNSTLTLTTPQNYLGLWWSAGDVGNRLEFYDGATLLGAFDVASVVPFLNSSYYGNPNGGGNAGEPYVYLNFTTTDGSQISSVKFIELTGGGFEMDNFSVTDRPILPPGHSTPDGGSIVALLGAGLATLGVLKRKLG